jgi:LmbE family N-acetylglucosaminyl deacetylase
MVAHPDDCIIFASGFIKQYKDFNWTICYLTYKDGDPRSVEISNFWSKRNIATKFLGYTDNYKDLEEGVITHFDTVAATESIKNVIKDYDLVLTHHHNGDYGHVHHKFVCEVVCANHTHVVTFAQAHNSNVKYTLDLNFGSLDEIPLHRDVVSGFGLEKYYCVSERVKKIL